MPMELGSVIETLSSPTEIWLGCCPKSSDAAVSKGDVKKQRNKLPSLQEEP